MFAINYSKVLDNGYTVKGIKLAGLEDALQLAIAWTAQNPGRTITVREYLDDKLYSFHSIADGKGSTYTREIEKSRGLMPVSGEALFFFPPTEKALKKSRASKPAPVPEIRAQWEIAVTVEPGQWAMLARKDGVERSKTGTFERGASGQATYLQGVWDALSTIKRGMVGRVVLSVGDKNVARMLKGEMQSKKNSAALEQCRLIIKALGCVEIVQL